MNAGDISQWEILMLLCFACSWPISIVKSLRTKLVIGKSPFFMIIIMLGYVFGIIHKILNNHDIVTYLYGFNFLLVAFDLFLYYLFIGKNKEQLLTQSENKSSLKN
jgi:hypothetical protein